MSKNKEVLENIINLKIEDIFSDCIHEFKLDHGDFIPFESVELDKIKTRLYDLLRRYIEDNLFQWR